MATQHFIIIDGNSLLHRAWHALPPLTTKTGEVISAVYGFALIFLKVLKELKPDYLVVAFDTKAPTFRHLEFKEYKAKRVKQPDEFYRQIPRVKELLESFGVKYLEAPGYEADDIIASLKIKNQKSKIKNIVVSGDLDFLQLVDEKTEVYTLKKGITETMIYDKKAIKERFGLLPEQLIDFKALRGDPSDNIIGVKGIGEKTALELIKKFGSLENLYANLEKIEKEKIKNLLTQNKKQAFLAKRLVTIKKDLKIDFNLDGLRLNVPNKEKIIKLFQELEFRSLLPRVLSIFDEISPKNIEIKPAFAKASAGKPSFESETDYVLIDSEKKFEDFLVQLKKQKIFALDTETTSLDPFSAKLLGISFSWQTGQAYYLPNTELQIMNNELRIILENPEIKKIGHNIKYDLEVLENQGIKLEGIYFDTMIAAYLLNPGARLYSLDLLTFSDFGHQMITLESLIGKGKKQLPIEMIPLEKLAHYSCEDADYTWRLNQKFETRLQKKGKISFVFEKIEMPLIKVLAKMEKKGVKINEKFLAALAIKTKKEIESLEKKIFALAGLSFNINSSQQLKEVLFNRLKISSAGLAKTKTGISTAASELEKLKNLHPIIKLISKHRELSKLSSTYLEALPRLISPQTKRIHTSFNQTITATGRLSSSEPNLQNIPIRSTFGREIRKAFIPENGYSLLSADYSQIELRIAASLAKDLKMLQTFKKGEDIHQQTAAEIKGTKPESVGPELRRLAKVINFGILYGLGAQGVAESTGFSKEEAADFIKKYFTIYPGIKKYIKEAKDFARKKGYAETLFGRRRYLPEINSQVQVLKSEAERMAVNLPVQGLAADLIKLAMIAIDKKIEELNLPAKMILQVHDELIFEVKDEKNIEVAKIVKKIMENPPLKLLASIKVEIKTGKSWGRLKAY